MTQHSRNEPHTSRKHSLTWGLVVAVVFGMFNGSRAAEDRQVPFDVPGSVASVLKEQCIDCHGPDSNEADVRLDQLTEMDTATRNALLNRVQDQIFFGLMPPEDADQPNDLERDRLADWVRNELRRHNASQLDQKLQHPEYGNYVDHEQLFSGGSSAKPFTPARRWLVSPQIFIQRVNEVFRLEGRSRKESFYGVTNPFVLPDHSGVRDYDTGILDGGHLLVMHGNAQWISQKQIFAAVHAGQDRRRIEFPNPKDRWLPPTSPPEFVAIVGKDSAPTDQELLAAINAQFDCVLKRPPTTDEQRRYLGLVRSTIELGGNAEGLRQMLVSVLLESDFLYRVENGAGEPDEFGRRMLSPHEAAQAIAYALGDRGPDELLTTAAEEGRLNSKADFEREVRRLLSDETLFIGPVDPGLSGKNMRSHVVTHPKLVRFFREFFGYTNATKIFKDVVRSDGYYQNPGRGTAGTPGFLIKEADRIVDWHLQRDQNVFESLLTTDEYFVYHDKDNETGRQIIAEWTEAYEKLKDTDWKTDPNASSTRISNSQIKKVTANPRRTTETRTRSAHVLLLPSRIGKGRTPFTTVSFAHGYTYNHSPFYNLPPTPGSFGTTEPNKRISRAWTTRCFGTTRLSNRSESRTARAC